MSTKIIGFVCILFVAGVSAQQKGVSLLATEAKVQSSNTYAVIVGISDYQDPGIPDLRFADKDAEAFANFMRSSAGGKLDQDHMMVLINQEATMAQFANKLDWLMENVKEGDQAIIYFSGHGDVEKRTLTQPGFLLCWDAPARVYMAGGAFALPMLQEVVSTLSIQNKAKVIVITDACRSGTLAGNSVGGAQATAANMAKQFANEIKIMSCQPNEYSIEGEQWGGGRGAFSYHLLEALYGLADNNKDLWVTLHEVGRYLEDHVTGEVAPLSQIPMTVGNRNEKLTQVDPQLLTTIRSAKSNQLMQFSSVETRGIEEDVIASLDTNALKIYAQFKMALQQKNFLEPEGACAEFWFQKLIKEPKMQRLYSTMKRNYAAALQDDAQQVINSSLNSDLKETLAGNLSAKAKEFNRYDQNLTRAAELLGPNHYMYKTLKARAIFFEANAQAMSNPKKVVNTIIFDKELANKLIGKYQEALNWEIDLPWVYLNLGFIYGLSLSQLDSAEYFINLAMNSSPSWIYPYTLLSDVYFVHKPEKRRIPLDQANKIDSNSNLLIYKWAGYYRSNNQFDSAEVKLLRLIDVKEMNICRPCVHTALGVLYELKGRFEDAEKQHLISYQLDSTLDVVFLNLSSAYQKMKRYDDAEFMAKKHLARFPNEAKPYSVLANIYQETKKFQLADSLCHIALKIDSLYYLAYTTLGNVYKSTGRIKEAVDILKTGIRNNPNNAQIWMSLGQLYHQIQNLNEAKQAFERGVELDFNNMMAHYYLGQIYNMLKMYAESEKECNILLKFRPGFAEANYNLACALSMQNKTEDAFIQLEAAFQKGFLRYNDIINDSDLENLKRQSEKWNLLMKKYFPNK